MTRGCIVKQTHRDATRKIIQKQLLMLPPVSHFDIAILGAGIAGASLAAALGDSGLTVALIEASSPRAPQDAWDSRIYAISPGSMAFLRGLGAAAHLDDARIARIDVMKVYGDQPSASLYFNAYDAGLAELAFIAEGGRIQHALWQCVTALPDVTVFHGACGAIDVGERHATLALERGETLTARLAVGADGARSWLREAAGFAVRTHDYEAHGVVANFNTEKPHHGTAWQWFRADGILALLPMPGRRVSMVWSAPRAHADELMAATADELAHRVAAASAHAAGALQVITPPAAFPLMRQTVHRLVQPRVALIGDAAHNVHPLAGQGVNLGLRDARELAAVLRNRGACRDCGDTLLLRRYERARKEDVLGMSLATDGLQKLFASNAVWTVTARNLGMRVVDQQRWLKTLLTRHAAA
jgi:ubiquinone biosynthesis UbiH/UbiF/VisC/COQ6 family hydroxylase